jgi:hypothetical protein
LKIAKSAMARKLLREKSLEVMWNFREIKPRAANVLASNFDKMASANSTSKPVKNFKLMLHNWLKRIANSLFVRS